jgi:hypothetical protein
MEELNSRRNNLSLQVCNVKTEPPVLVEWALPVSYSASSRPNHTITEFLHR